jgi:sugar phosphate isomerase/epimerase
MHSSVRAVPWLSVAAMRLPHNALPAPLSMGAMCFRDRPFPEIVAAAAASGFSGVGLTVGQCVAALERGIPFAELATRLDDAGLRVAELELVRLCEDGPVRYASSLVEDLSHVLKPDRVHTAAFTGELPCITDEYAALCDRLAHVDVALEFMPYSQVPNLSLAIELVHKIGATNARVVLDVVHFFRSGGRPTELAPAQLEKVAVVQLSDVSARHGVSVADEARHLRTYPGQGSLDITAFLTALGAAGDTLPPISVEPISDALELLPLSVVAEQTMFSTLAVLTKSGWIFDASTFTHRPQTFCSGDYYSNS